MRIDLVGTTADFRRPGPRHPLPLNHLPGENRGTAGRIGEVGLGRATPAEGRGNPPRRPRTDRGLRCASPPTPLMGTYHEPICWPTNVDALAAFRYPHHGALDAHADQAQPEGPHRVGPDQQARGPVVAKATHSSPLAQPVLRRQTSKVGAGCGNAARPVLCGGCSVTGIPTAIAREAFRGERLLFAPSGP